ncbi:transposase [Streptomyces sp. NPDC006334]|uniref:IS110 family transposase n=1 Tax=Streptomyces sp. NPDC006334 TaxID=3156754 RepID=UPI0033AD206A
MRTSASGPWQRKRPTGTRSGRRSGTPKGGHAARTPAAEVIKHVPTPVHVAAVISPLGKILGTESFPATAAGYRQLLVWARKRGRVRRAGVEGTGTFGAGLSRYLLAQQIQVYEVNRPDRSTRRLLGKSDPLDRGHQAPSISAGAVPRGARTSRRGDEQGVRSSSAGVNRTVAVSARTQPRADRGRSGCRESPRTTSAWKPVSGMLSEITRVLLVWGRRTVAAMG